MKHLLIVSYYFPPMGGVPVRRVLRLLRHLPESGWRCSVLTADRPYDPFHPLDPAGTTELPGVERVIRPPARAGAERLAARIWSAMPRRAGGTPGAVAGGLRARLHESVFFPDPKRFWVRGAVSSAGAALAADPVDGVLSSGYPWSGFVAGDRLARHFGVPHVLDYRDAWSLNPRGHWPGPRNRALEADLIGRSALVVAATDWIRDALRERFETPAGPAFETLRNAWDPDELPAPDPALSDPDHLLLGFTGTFNDAFPPGPMDQSPHYLTEAVAALSPEIRADLRIRLIGRVGVAHVGHMQRRGVAAVFELPGVMPHGRALQQQLAADWLVVIVSSGHGPAGVLTGKLLEYAGAQRPVLALAPDGEAARFVKERGMGVVLPPEDVPAIAAWLTEQVRRWRVEGTPPALVAPLDLAAGGQSRRLADMLDGLAGRGR